MFGMDGMTAMWVEIDRQCRKPAVARMPWTTSWSRISSGCEPGPLGTMLAQVANGTQYQCERLGNAFFPHICRALSANFPAGRKRRHTPYFLGDSWNQFTI